MNKLLVALALTLLLSPVAQAETAKTIVVDDSAGRRVYVLKKPGRWQRFKGAIGHRWTVICEDGQRWADNHPKQWKGIKFTGKTTLYTLNLAAAVGQVRSGFFK